MKAAVIVFPASNCDRDVKEALERTPGITPVMVWHKSTELPKVDLIVIPGGFAFGDYLRAGAMAAHSPVMYEVRRRADRGTPILGICNGFQVLTEAGLLPGAFLQNARLKFVSKERLFEGRDEPEHLHQQVRGGPGAAHAGRPSRGRLLRR